MLSGPSDFAEPRWPRQFPAAIRVGWLTSNHDRTKDSLSRFGVVPRSVVSFQEGEEGPSEGSGLRGIF